MIRQVVLLNIKFVIIAIIFSGCSVNSKKAYFSNATLASGKWVLLHLSGTEVVKEDSERLIYLEFNETDRKLLGFTGCNRVFGAYITQANNITFARLGSTKLMCADINVETSFLNNLQRVNRYEINGEMLQLFDKSTVLITMRLLSD